jgi:predicted permease
MSAWRWLFRRRSINRDLDDEIRGHMRMAIEERVAAGEDPEAARLAAMKDFGNVLQTVEATRHVWRGAAVAAITDLWQDVRFGVRMLVKNPAFSLVVIGVLALGIAGNATVFSLFKGLALTPLPGVRESSRLAVILNRTPGGRSLSVAVPDFRHLRQHSQSFVDLTASTMFFATVGRGTESERIAAELVAGNYFQALGVGAQVGRTLLPSDDLAPGQHPVAVISDSLWQRRFGADRTIVGQTLHLNGQPLTIVGVADRDFNGSVVSIGMDVFVPLMMQPQLLPPNRLDTRGVMMMNTLGHLRPGVTIGSAAAEIRVLHDQLDADQPLANADYRATVVPIWQSPHGAQTYWLPAVVMLGGMGLLILIIVCANVANLVLARGVGRRGELAVRVALGASRARVLRLLLVENLVLALPGALAGVALATAIVPWLVAGAAEVAPTRTYLDTAIDGVVTVFALALSCGCAMIFGFLPALRISRVAPASLLGDASQRVASGSRLRGVLVVSQIAIALVLLVGAGLLLRSYQSAQGASGGFDATGVTALSIDLAAGGYDEAQGKVFLDRLSTDLRSEPTFSSVSLATRVPLSLVDGPSRSVVIEGYTARADEDLSFLYNIVSPEYFQTLRVPLLAGRDFAATDDATATPVVIVNEALATRMWRTPDAAIGKRLRSGGAWLTVVGVVGDLKYSRLTEESRPYLYWPLLQSYSSQVTIHARSKTTDAATALRQARDRVRALDPQLPIARSLTLAEQSRQALSVYQMATGTLTMFGTMTIVLAAIGIYGLVAYSVKQSTQEIGIRMAIGASRTDVMFTFLRRGTGLAAIGAVAGLALALVLSRSIGSLLYGVTAYDALAFTGATVIVMAIALTASLLPAWTASRTDPLSALRHR